MTLLAGHAITKSFGSRLILDGADLAVEPKARIGVVGANGSGKSTLLKILAGLETSDRGEVSRRRGARIAYLDQHPAGDARTALETVIAARPDLVELERELMALAAELGSDEVMADLGRMTRVLARQERVLEQFEAAGGPSAEGRARASLLEIGLTTDELALPTRTLSGGQRKLIALAACLEQKPDVLLLDEPEAHLDNDGRARVELLARRFEGAIVAVSHDRYLLDEIVDQIASLDRGQIRLWAGTYSAYTLERELEVVHGERVGVVGRNGAGKSVLLNAVSLLMKFLFPDEQVRRANRLLSGGERTRLQLLLLMLARPNLLVLDEPTNHLDIESVEALETAIEEFTGTVVAISHDRYFLDRVADRIVEVDGSVRATDGGYSAWLERKSAATA